MLTTIITLALIGQTPAPAPAPRSQVQQQTVSPPRQFGVPGRYPRPGGEEARPPDG